MSCLAQLAAGLSGLPAVNLLQLGATATYLRCLHGQRFWCRSSEWGGVRSIRGMAAQAQVHVDEDHFPSHIRDEDLDSVYEWRSPSQHGPSVAVLRPGQEAAAASTAASSSSSSSSSSRRYPAASATPHGAASVALSTEEQVTSDPEGGVVYPEGALLRHIQLHWQQLRDCPSAYSYTENIHFDEFGARYIQQLEREETSRSRALAQLRRELAADARSGRSYRQGGGVANRLVSAWVPLLQQAVEEEQQQVLASAGKASASSRKDRHNYGPYLLLLSAEDLAHITLQTVLSRIATALPEADDLLEAASPFSSSSWQSTSGTSTSYGGSSSSDSGTAGDAVMSPAVMLADSIGRGVNSRVKYLRFKHHQREWDKKEREFFKSMQAGQFLKSMQPVGDKLSCSLKRYSKHNNKEAAEYAAGQQRLDSFTQLKSLRKNEREAAKAAQSDVHWDQEVRIKVGAALLALLVENSHLPAGLPGFKPKVWSNNGSNTSSTGAADVPAFEYVYMKQGLKQQSFVRASHALVQVLLADRSLAAALLTKVPPMLVPPLPWSSYCKGGYLTSRHWMMRTRFSTTLQQELKRGMEQDKYGQVLSALNVLGNTAWKVNRQVYGVLTHLWASRSTAGGLPQQSPIKTPPPPTTGYRLVFENGGLSARSGPWSKRERRGHVLACDDVRRLNRNMASLKADFLLKLKVAEDFVDAPEFYYPHTLDFRGRAYPLHPSLHHLGDDTCRGLLMFARGVPLGPQGLDWLYVHLANVWGQGQDKLSFDGRRAFARAHLATILAVASDPLRNTWWQDAEKPWQALAACCEIAAALQSMEPASYVSHLPVHMDGSCNGLQHYAALGRDEAGGRAVNLLPSDKPQDVYKGVAEIVARRAANDAAAGVLEAQRCVSLIDRKLVKQTVMTSVYGVTPVGARAQIEARLKERRTDMKAKAALVSHSSANGSSSSSSSSSKSSNGQQRLAGASSSSNAVMQGWLAAAGGGAAGAGAAGGGAGQRDEYSWMDDKDLVWQVSKYLADQTMDAIGEMFGSARAIMAWLADCARLVAGENAPVKWSSPLGLPITQPYHKLTTTHIHTATQSFSVVSSDGAGGDGSAPQWLKARQRSAFPPNFIHSIDSTHMMLTALACSEAAVTFAGVHDSFWTHAGHVPVMNKLLREKFVELHTAQPDLLEDLLSQLQAQHPGLEFPPIPARGKLQVSRVKSSRYFFS